MLFIFTVIVLVLCHAQESHSRPGSDLDTSVFELEYDYNYDSEPYFPQENMGLKEARMVDPWTLDFRRKLAARENIGKTHMHKLTATIRKNFLLLQSTVCNILSCQYSVKEIFSVKIWKLSNLRQFNAISTLHINSKGQF